ncbi:MAG: L,D-transpeptidase family protein [Sphingomonas sp.]|nr:L,D-transpeptidase family protein [Sphingomonas sp.]
MKIATFLSGLVLPAAAMAQQTTPPQPSFQSALPSQQQAPGALAVGNATLEWTADADGYAAATFLAARLAVSDIEGYAKGPADAAAINQALAAARTGSEADKQTADRVLTAAFLDFVEFLQAPVPGVIYGDDWARPDRISRGVHLKNGTAVPSLAAYVERTLTLNSFYEGLRTAAMQEAPTGEDLDKVIASLARARAFPKRGRFVVVDSASQRMYMYEQGRLVDHMKIVVGKTEEGPQLYTPEIASVIYRATFNPYWHVPDHLVKNVTNRYLAEGDRYLNGKGYEVIDSWDVNAKVLDPKTVDWRGAGRRGELKIRQRPGPTNSMGNMKFNFPNPEGIYLHDTEKPEYFDLQNRAKSNGCVRVEDYERFAKWLYKGGPIPQTDQTEHHILIPEPTPVYVTYMTAHAHDGPIAYSQDRYQKDATTLAALNARNQLVAPSAQAPALGMD